MIWIQRREFITLLGGAAVAWPLFARSQERPKPLRIGTVSLNRRAPNPQRVAFEQRLRELGYSEGQNLVIEYINAPDRPDRIDEAARELVQRNVDIIVLENHITLKSVMSATSTLPIVIIATSFDPVALGVVASIARPGGNITGFYVRRPELVEKQIGLLAETFPGRTRLGVIWDAVSGEAFPAVERTAIALRWGLEPLKLEHPPYDFVAAFRSLAQRGAQMVLVLHSGLFTEDRSHIAALALQHGLPSMFTDKIYAEAGGLMSYGPDLSIAFRRAADYVDRIAKGAKPADLPIEQPTSFVLTLNLKTARALSLDVPPTLLARAAAWPLVARAQQGERMRRIGILLPAAADDSRLQAWVGAFLQGLALSGWTIGRNVRIDTRWAGADAAEIRRHAAELVALAPDVILAQGASAVGPLLQATRTVPIVFPVVVDPVGAGFVDSLAQPGRNATGFMSFEFSLGGKWLDLLKQIAPGVTRVAVLQDPTLPAGLGQLGAIQTAAPSFGVELRPADVRDAGDIERAVTAFARSSNGG